MNFIYKFLYFLQGEMTRPTVFGWFHIIWLIFTFIMIYIFYKRKKFHDEKQLKIILGVYGIIAFVLELLKQLIWSFNYDVNLNIVTWDYQWYAFPYQLCSTPIYVSIFCLFLKNGKLRNYLLSYMAYFTILGSISTMIYPESCFVSDILVNIHTMWLHMGSFVVSVYLLMSGEVKININSLKNAVYVFLLFVLSAFLLNIFVYNSGILGDETFNMFYISPYFKSSLPIFDIIWEYVHYIVFLIIYIWALILGSLIIYGISKFICYISNKIYCKKI